jgi:hypothetical protein
MSITADRQRESKGLRAGAIGLVGSIVVGIASTAPAYSLAASLGYVVIMQNGSGIVGVKAPLIMVLRLPPDVLHRGRVLRAEQGGARLRHHLHLGPRARSARGPGGSAAGHQCR